MSFKGYLRHRRVTDDPAGDFVAVAQLDGAMPDADTWDDLRRYLEQRHATAAVLETAHKVWRAYIMARLRRRGRRARA